MNRTGFAIAIVGTVQLLLSSVLLLFVSQTCGTDFSTYWSASGWTIWYPQYVAGFTLIAVGLVVAFVTQGGDRKPRAAR